MTDRQQRKKPAAGKQSRDSVFKEAWEKMNADLARVMPGFLAKRLHGGRGKLWLVLGVTLVELVVLAVIGKFLFAWFSS